MSKIFTALVVWMVILGIGVTLSWAFSGIMTPWGVMVLVMASFISGAYSGTAWERAN